MKDRHSEEEFMQRYEGFMASECQAQVPVFSKVGRGLRGDSFRIEETIEDSKTTLTGISTDHTTGDDAEDWKVILTDTMPTIGYRLYQGVRTIDGQPMNGWYLRLRSKVAEAAFPLWEFDTPFTPISKYTSTDPIPADEIISQSY